MEQSLSRESVSSTGSQDIPYFECNPKTAICPCTKPHEYSPWTSVLLLYVAHQYHRVYPNSLFPSDFLIKTRHTTCPAPVILIDLIIPIIFCEEYKSSNPLLCSSIRLSVSSSLLGSSIPLSTQLSLSQCVCSSFSVQTGLLTCMK